MKSKEKESNFKNTFTENFRKVRGREDIKVKMALELCTELKDFSLGCNGFTRYSDRV